MATPSKEENILKLILENSPLKHWHFEELVEKANITRAAADKWLKRYQKKGLILRVKQKGKFPYYTVGSSNNIYLSQKKIFILKQLYNSGLITSLLELEKARLIIIFGSTIKGDWYKDSDIDIFIYGSSEGFEKSLFERKLGRNIELHIFKSIHDIKGIRSGLIHNIMNGYIVKGTIQDLIRVV